MVVYTNGGIYHVISQFNITWYIPWQPWYIPWYIPGHISGQLAIPARVQPPDRRRSSAFEFSLWTPDFDSESAAGPVRSSAAH